MLPSARRAAFAAVLATAVIAAAPLAAAEPPLQPVGDFILAMYEEVFVPVDDAVDQRLLAASAAIGVAREAANQAGDDAVDRAFGVAAGQTQTAQLFTGAIVGGADQKVRDLGEFANRGAALAAAGAHVARAGGDAATDRLGEALEASTESAQALGARRASGLQATEEAVLVPLPEFIMDTYRTVPDPRIPVRIIIPEENPQLLEVIDDPSEVPYTDPVEVLEAARAFAANLGGTPGQAVVITDAYLAAAAEAVAGGAGDAVADATDTAGAIAGAVTG